MRAAVPNAIAAETSARLQMQAVALGTPIKFLSPQEAKNAATVSETPNLTGGEERTWSIWAAQAHPALAAKIMPAHARRLAETF